MEFRTKECCSGTCNHLRQAKLFTTAQRLFVIIVLSLHFATASNLDLRSLQGRHTLTLEQKRSRHFGIPLSYPKCTRDSGCPADQVCKFLTQQNIAQSFLALNAPEVSIFLSEKHKSHSLILLFCTTFYILSYYKVYLFH